MRAPPVNLGLPIFRNLRPPFGPCKPLRWRYHTSRIALVAQSVEQLTLNQRVQGSSPCGGTRHEIPTNPWGSHPKIPGISPLSESLVLRPLASKLRKSLGQGTTPARSKIAASHPWPQLVKNTHGLSSCAGIANEATHHLHAFMSTRETSASNRCRPMSVVKYFADWSYLYFHFVVGFTSVR